MPQVVLLPGGVRAAWTGRAEGDLGPDAGGDVSGRRREVLDRPWAWLRQVHGADVVTVAAGRVVDGLEADALVSPPPADASYGPDVGLAVFTADCAPLALASPEGVMAAVHAGWRGVVAGVVQAAVDSMRRAGAGEVVGALGPCIHAECYEFGVSDLTAVERAVGREVGASTASGAPALDLPAAVATELYSHRARGDRERQALVVWRD